jgi:AraC-like DNA-binding protein
MANQRGHSPKPAPVLTIKPLPAISPARRRKILAEREAWLRQADLACSFQRLFDAIPGLQFFAKNRRGEIMLASRGNRDQSYPADETAIIGLTEFDLNPPSLARSHVEDDARICATGRPLLNHVELGFDEQAMPDWFVVNKMPVRSRAGKIIGIMGFSQAYQQRAKLLSPFQSIAKAVNHVRQNYSQTIAIGDLVRLVGLSARQLERKFKACFGLGPRQFLIKTRLLAACRRLTVGNDGLSRIACESGFADPSAFARQFRRHLGMAPRQFRRSPPLSGRLLSAAANRTSALASKPPLTPARRGKILARREAWLREADLAGSFQRLFDAIPGVQFFAKNRRGKMMFASQGNRDKFRTTDETAMIGLTDFDLNPPSLAQSYVDDDARIYATGQPLLNHIELGFDEQAMPDWFVVNKTPIRSRTGKIIGIMGFSQACQQRASLLSPFHGISKAVLHVRENYPRDIAIGDLVRLVGLSARQLERKFKSCFGLGPRQFLIKTRLLAACRRLTATDDGLAQIAYECGFTHPSAFAHQFRRHLGLTPREFRRRRLAR